ncbi:hypothetical protein AB0M05_29675 [Streptomyces violaceusniger]|uniref:hypothetical protein n=1 Tax=Streptomyces violaceusniger TaxID=68280 RepID=UPI00342707E6
MSQSLADAGTAAFPVAEIALTIDDTPLDRMRPQLVLARDRCGARHISGIDVVRVDGGHPAWT